YAAVGTNLVVTTAVTNPLGTNLAITFNGGTNAFLSDMSLTVGGASGYNFTVNSNAGLIVSNLTLGTPISNKVITLGALSIFTNANFTVSQASNYSVVWSGNTFLSNATLTANATNTLGNVAIAGTGTIGGTSVVNVTGVVSNDVSGPGQLVKAGAGTLFLTNLVNNT